MSHNHESSNYNSIKKFVKKSLYNVFLIKNYSSIIIEKISDPLKA